MLRILYACCYIGIGFTAAVRFAILLYKEWDNEQSLTSVIAGVGLMFFAAATAFGIKALSILTP